MRNVKFIYLKFSTLGFLTLNAYGETQSNSVFEKITSSAESAKVQSFSGVRQRTLVEEKTQQEITTRNEIFVRPEVKTHTLNAQEQISEKAELSALEAIALIEHELRKLKTEKKSSESNLTDAMKFRSTVPYYNDQQLLTKVAVGDTSTIPSFDISAFPLFEKETPKVTRFEENGSMSPLTLEKLKQANDPEFSYSHTKYVLAAQEEAKTVLNLPSIGDEISAYTYVQSDEGLELRKATSKVQEVISKNGDTYIVVDGLTAPSKESDIFCLNKDMELIGFIERTFPGKTSKTYDLIASEESTTETRSAVSIVKVIKL